MWWKKEILHAFLQTMLLLTASTPGAGGASTLIDGKIEIDI
jgi:hypothetical protein